MPSFEKEERGGPRVCSETCAPQWEPREWLESGFPVPYLFPNGNENPGSGFFHSRLGMGGGIRRDISPYPAIQTGPKELEYALPTFGINVGIFVTTIYLQIFKLILSNITLY